MDILDYLKKRQSELEVISHPIAGKDENFKYLYCFGLGVMALGHMKAITELQTYFESVLDSIYISKKNREQLIADINNYFEFRMNEFLKKIVKKDDQYCFMADLYKLYQMSLWSEEYCKGVMENYIKIFRFSEAEKEFFEKFNEANRKEDVAAAVKAYKKFKENGYDIRYQTLVYFFPEFSLEESYGDITVEAGQTLMLDKPTTIQGNIIVERGGSLLIYGAYVRMKGYIWTNGGRVQLRGARIKVEKCDRDYWLNLSETAVVQVESSFIDCENQCGFLTQNSGRLIILSSEIRNTSGKRAVRFEGLSLVMRDSECSGNKDGAIELFSSAKMIMNQCRFYDAQAEYGAAIYSESIGNVKIQDCEFFECHAKYLGAAIYFKYKKYGQYVKNAVCSDCTPQDSQIFNVYDDDFELKIR